MNTQLFIFMLFSLQLFYWFVGRRASKEVKDQEEYFFAGKKVKLFPLMMTFLATQVGGGIVLGSAEEAYKFGSAALLYPLGAALGLMILGLGVGRKLASLGVSTIAEIFETAYGSPLLRKAASFLSIVSLFMVLVAQVLASHKFLVSMGLTNDLLFILFWMIVIIYTSQGGFKAVVSTDIVQAAFFALVFFAGFGVALYAEPSLANKAIAATSPADSAVNSKLLGWLLMPMLFMVIEQDMGQRCFAGSSPRVVSWAAFLSGLATCAICVIPVFFGCLAKALNLQIPEGGSVFMVAIGETAPSWMAALVGCAVLAAIISTATSLINAISSNISCDFKIIERSSVRTIQWITLVLSLGAIFFAYQFNNIVDLLIQSYELTVSCLFIPVAFALYRKQRSFLPALLSMGCGALAFFLFRLYPIGGLKEVTSILCSLAGFGIGNLLGVTRLERSRER
jgi:SSS family solute:Na+ symporter